MPPATAVSAGPACVAAARRVAAARQPRRRALQRCRATPRRDAGGEPGRGGDGKPGGSLPDLAGELSRALGGLFPPSPGGAGGAFPPVADPAEALRALGETLRDGIAQAAASAVPTGEDYPYEDYEGYGEEDAEAGRRFGPAAASRLRALSTLAADRRERMQDTARAASLAAAAAAEATSAADAAEADALLPWEADAAEARVAVGSPGAQRAAALAALRAARAGGPPAASLAPGAAQRFRELTLVEEEYRPPPPPPTTPRARAVDAPLGRLGALGVLQQEWGAPPAADEGGAAQGHQAAEQQQQPAEAETQAAAAGAPDAVREVQADVDAILSSALSELGLDGDDAAAGGDTVVRVSGEQMAARVQLWQEAGQAASEDD